MKRIIIVLFVLFSCMETFAQKSYIFVRAIRFDNNVFDHIYLSGNLPSNIESDYKYSTLGDIMNKLSECGYDLEFCLGEGNSFVFSKNTSNPPSGTRNIISDDGDVREVARYNLQGMPIKSTEKGVQIIVYSNYTSKTVIVQ